MAKQKKTGIVYVMSCTQGLLKIGCTQTDQFENRMRILESDGYKQFNGFHREFAVEVEDYEKKETLVHRLFDKSQVKINGKGIEMFATDIDLVKDLLRAFSGRQIYPPVEEQTEKTDTPPITKPRKTPAPRLTFKMLSIPVGSTLIYRDDPSVSVITADDDNNVSYKGKKYSLSGLVKHLKGSGAYQGGVYFLYKGKTLVKLREELEKDKGRST